MALKQLLLSRKIEECRAKMHSAEQRKAELKRRREEMNAREAELEQAVNEVTEETSDEDRAALEAETEAYQSEESSLADEEQQVEEERESIQSQINTLQQELDELNARSSLFDGKKQERKEGKPMDNRKFFNLSTQERDAFFARDDVKSFLIRLREIGQQKRAVTGAELTIPTVVLDLIRENVINYSKLYRHVRVRQVPGKARQIIMGTIPEAVWTEMCAKLNELDLVFNDVEIDGYKVGGYIAICNATLADSDLALGSEIISALGQAIGLALDKAILYGTGTKMPLGVMPRLAQTTEPEDYPASARKWENVSTTNVITVTGKTGLELFQALMTASGAAKGKYSRGEKVWVMNESTYTTLMANAMSINAAGAITSGVNGTMPVIGGVIEVLSFIPDNVIIGGFFDLYLLAEREGTTVAQSEHYRFVEDQTVFKGTARYDGVPVIAEAFVAIGISGNTPSATAVTFAEDKANP